MVKEGRNPASGAGPRSNLGTQEEVCKIWSPGTDLGIYEMTDLYKSLEISKQTQPSAGIQEFMVQIVREKNVSRNLL